MNRDIVDALSRIPTSVFVLAAAHEDQRSGTLARWVQPCSLMPPMLMISVEKGHTVSPLIRDSRRFSVCQLVAGDRHTARRFSQPMEPGVDPFIGVEAKSTPSGMPVLAAALSCFDCELVRHIDIESDCELYVGLIQDARILRPGRPDVLVRLDGAPSGNGSASPQPDRP